MFNEDVFNLKVLKWNIETRRLVMTRRLMDYWDIPFLDSYFEFI